MNSPLQQKLKDKTAKIGIIGLGYVGLTWFEGVTKAGFAPIGYDKNEQKVTDLQHSLTLAPGSLLASDPTPLQEADVVVISVGTTIDADNQPDLRALRAAMETVATLLHRDMLIILQSTSYPGTTEEELLPLLEASGLKVGTDFYLAFVPETLDTTLPQFSFATLPKIIGGVTPACFGVAKLLFDMIGVSAIHQSSPKVAEAAKLLQNAYRLINVSFINEMKIALDAMGIDIWDVIEAASSKPYGFTPFYPGPGIGGECIPVDPLFLTWKASSVDASISMINRATEINDTIPLYVIEKTKAALEDRNTSLSGAKVLVLGIGFKKDTDDIRFSPSQALITLLKKGGATVDYHDPLVQTLPEGSMESIQLDKSDLSLYDCVIIATDHSTYNWKDIAQRSSLIVDTRNVLPEKKDHVIKA